jgi:hypothetical protein
VNGIGSKPDPRYENFRNNLGYILRFSRRLNLANVTAQGSLSSTGFCLAQTPPIGAEYLIYAPSGGPFTVDLTAMPSSRWLTVEWFNPATGRTTHAGRMSGGSHSQSFTPPFSGDAVLYLVDAAGHKQAYKSGLTVGAGSAVTQKVRAEEASLMWREGFANVSFLVAFQPRKPPIQTREQPLEEVPKPLRNRRESVINRFRNRHETPADEPGK